MSVYQYYCYRDYVAFFAICTYNIWGQEDNSYKTTLHSKIGYILESKTGTCVVDCEVKDTAANGTELIVWYI